MATVEYRNVGKAYGAVRVIRDLSFSIADRQFVVLLGPSGCGKTTLLRMTAGLESITEGEVRIKDQRVNDRHPRDRDIAMVFQNYALYPTMKVRDNIGFSLEVAKMPPAEVGVRVGRAAEILNLTPFLDRYPKELSGGQRQRVAMGRAMVREPAVFLFDEPLSNLDAKLRAHMRAEIRQLHDRLDTTTVYVTHDQIEAMTMADRIVVMRAGDVEQIGTPDEVYDRPASRYVADFIGAPAINFIEGTLAGQDAAPVVETASGMIPVAVEAVARAAPGQRVVIGIRPTDVVADPAGPIHATTRLVERLGHDVQLVTGAGGGDFVAVVPRGTPVAQGAEIRFAMPPDKVHVFDAATERRI